MDLHVYEGMDDQTMALDLQALSIAMIEVSQRGAKSVIKF